MYFFSQEVIVCAWGYYNVKIPPTLVLWLTQWFHTPWGWKLCNLSIIYDECKCWLFNLQHYVYLYVWSTYTQWLPLKSHNLPTAVMQRCQITIVSPSNQKEISTVVWEDWKMAFLFFFNRFFCGSAQQETINSGE